MAKVDIVVPCYNYGRFLEVCVRSVLDQSLSDVRVLIIDDASPDDSVAVARRLVQEDSRVSLIVHPVNKGHIATYNEGIEWASSDYFLLLSADDLLAPGALERAAEVMDANADIVLTYAEWFVWHDANPFPTIAPVASYSWQRRDLLTASCRAGGNLVATPTAIVRTSAQKAVGGYRPSLPHAGDLEMWLRFAAYGAVARIDAIQAIYRKHSTQMSDAYFAVMIRDYRQRQLAFDVFFQEFGERLADRKILQRAARRALAASVVHDCNSRFRQGRFKDGLALLRCAMDINPRLPFRPPLWSLSKAAVHGGRGRLKAIFGDTATRLLRRGSAAV